MQAFIKNSSFMVFLAASLALSAMAGAAYYLFRPDYPIFSFVSAFYAFLIVFIIRVAVTGKRRSPRNLAFLTIPFLMVTFWLAMHAMFADFNVHAIIYHAIYGFTSNGIPTGYFELTCFVLAGACIIGMMMTVLVQQSKLFSRVDQIACVPLIVLNPLTIESLEGFGLMGSGQDNLYAHYAHIDETKLAIEQKPNLIHIFLESAERTLVDADKFGPIMQPILDYEKRGLTATDVRQVENTEWTMAGMVAANCGVPLVQPWLVQSIRRKATEGPFLKNATCLGDILKLNGYHARYIMGPDVSFAGTGDFYTEHGFADAEGLNELLGTYPDHLADWGLTDVAVFDYAERTIRSLSAGGDPYAVTISSIGGHGPSGHASPECLNGEVEIRAKTALGIGVECANVLVRAMLDRLEQDGLLSNTIVVLQSDHLLMRSQFSHELDHMDRRNLFIAFGPGVETKKITRPATMMDIYPTILDLLGFNTPKEQAALGTSLRSDHRTLIEALGEEALNDAIKYDVKLRRWLWLGESVDASISTASTND